MEEKLDTLMDKRLSQLEEAQQKFAQKNQIYIPKIQSVPKFLRKNKRFAKYCSPKIISFGPIHHNSEGLEEGEHYKLLWTSLFVEEYGKRIEQDANQLACQLLLKKIEDNIDDLKNMFTEDAIEGYNDNDLAWILFVDGCSLLHFMENIDGQSPEALNLKFDRMMFMFRDAMLLENQLPSKMLDILCKEKGLNLEYCYSNYNTMGECKRRGKVLIPLGYPIPFHILDSWRSNHIEGQNQFVLENTILSEDVCDEELDFNWNTYKSIQDLKKVGIKVMRNEEDEWSWSNISFKSKWFSGELRLPIFSFNDVTPYFFRNLIAYEMCPDVRYNYECCSFFSFMDSLVDNAEDVKELRLAGVFQNLLGSDEELAKLFNDLGDDLPTKMFCQHWPTNAVAYSKKYIQIKREIERHYTNKWKTWLAQAYNTHFNTPWAMIAFLAASLALLLTFIQTWYAIHPK
ncbi:hypothetical protein P8452_74820 [Trifolium repens]|nr:hypothetical protein P8452_74820 [Trifolium repens]